MQTLLPPAPCSGRFTAAPLSISAISVPRLPRTILKQNYTPSLPLKLNSTSPSFSSFISHRQWKLPFTVTASSQSSPAFTPSNEESEKAKLDQVAKRLEKTARHFKRLGSLGFWGQLVCTIVSAVILSFSVVVTGKVTSPATFYATAGGIAAAFISVFWSFGYIRLSERLRRTANDPTKAPPRSDVVKSLQNGIALNLLGMGSAILGMQATVGFLVAKALTSSANPYYQGIAPGSSPVLALDVFLVQDLTSESGTCDPLCSVDETSSLDFEDNYQPKTDLLKAVAVFAAAATGTVAINHSWVAANQDLAMALLFVIGYAGIIFEESLAFNKSGVGLLMAVSLWVIRSIGAPSTEIAVSELSHASAEVSEIVFFLLGAMTIVEIVDAHQGFKIVTDNIKTRNPRLLLWVVGFITFFLSSVLDNLTSTIVMVSLLRKLVPPSEYRKILGAVVVIAANAGGAWTPIGDVTTTMLWIHGQITTVQTMKGLFLPSAISLAVPLALMSLTSEANGKGQDSSDVLASEQMAPRGKLVFSVGLGALIFVPVFKAVTGLPPYMGMLLGLGVLWILTDAIHYGESEKRKKLKVPQALSRIDTQGALFFLGILLSVSSLEAAGILREIANYLDAHVQNSELIASAIGVISAIIDNVPLVAATMGMYDVTSFPQDSEFWQLVAFCAGTGGSMLVIGSAAGVAFMGMEKVDFFWYFKKVSGFAFAGYAAGIAAYLAVHNLNISLPTTLAEVPFLSGS